MKAENGGSRYLALSLIALALLATLGRAPRVAAAKDAAAVQGRERAACVGIERARWTA